MLGVAGAPPARHGGCLAAWLGRLINLLQSAAVIDPTTALAFSLFENKGVYALLLGSGVSRAAQIPTGWEVVLDLVRRLAAVEGVDEQPDWAAWYVERFGAPPNYSILLDHLAQTPDERRAILHSYIEPTAEDVEEGRKTPTRAHRAIAKLVRDGFVRVLITTNFDRLLENALREEGVEPVVVKSDDDLAGAVPLIHSRCFIVKVHGDYLDTRLRNTEDELAGYSPAQDQLLDRIFDEHGLIVCGWSADWDRALRGAISRAPSRRYPLFWASRGSPSATANDLIQARAGRTIAIEDADSFFEGLQSKVEVQAALQRPNPLSVDLLVAAAKRYLARAEHRIQLADLIAGEVQRADELMGRPEFDTQTPYSPEEFRRRVARVEAIHEPLLRIFMLLGRWGDGSEVRLVADLAKAWTSARPDGGVSVWLDLHTYRAVQLFYAYGLGLTKAGRWKALLSWLQTPVRRRRSQSSRALVSTLFLWRWEGHDLQLWRGLEGMERRYVPLSDHLYDVFAVLFDQEFHGAFEFEHAFSIFETLAGFEDVSVGTEGELLTQSGVHRTHEVHMPVGRMCWKSEVREVVYDDLASGDLHKALLAAGFCRGQEEYLAETLKVWLSNAARTGRGY